MTLDMRWHASDSTVAVVNALDIWGRSVVKFDLKHIHAVKKRLANGEVRVHYYHRRTRQRIEGEPDTIQFRLAYEKACEAATKHEAETFAALTGDFFASQKFQSLSERTRADYIGHRPIIEAQWASLPLEALKDKRIKRDARQWRDGMVEKFGARQADLIFATARRIVSFGLKDGLLDVNHFSGIEAVYSADRSDIIWLPEHIETFWASNPEESLKLGLIMGLNIGRREGDLIRLTWGDYTGEFIGVTNRKGRRKIQISGPRDSWSPRKP